MDMRMVLFASVKQNFLITVLNFRGFHIVLSLDSNVTCCCSSKEEQMASDGAAHDSVTLYAWSSKNAKLKRIL